MAKDWLGYCEAQDFGDIHFKNDNATGLKAIIAIHNTAAGPSLGGCRFKAYDESHEALEDVLRLARGMTLKSILAGLPLGGGKSVILMPKGEFNRTALLKSFGRFIDSLGGRYITAVDMGTTVEDMDIIASETQYVSCTSQTQMGPSNPSVLTARGVFAGLKAAVKSALGTDGLSGVRVAIQGVGHVGYALAEMLKAEGAALIVCDPNEETAQKCRDETGAQIVALEDIYHQNCDVFSPCAMGGVLDAAVVDKLKARVIAGAANNQLRTPQEGSALQEKGILYTPDFVLNAGGIIHVAAQYTKDTEEATIARVDNIYNTCSDIFEQAKEDARPTSEVAEAMALKRLEEKEREHL